MIISDILTSKMYTQKKISFMRMELKDIQLGLFSQLLNKKISIFL